MHVIDKKIWTFSSNDDEPAIIRQKEIRTGFGPNTANSVKNFQDLVSKVAALGFKNRGYFLLFRGQNKDYHVTRVEKNKKTDYVSLYPALFRSENSRLCSKDRHHRWDYLETKTKKLINDYPDEKPDQREAKNCLAKNKEMAWAILQHYEKCPTPFLDLTHSLRVAASFATQNSDTGYVYVFGLPYPHGTISHFIDQDIVLIHLQSACHPSAKRPHFQEGWLAGSYYLSPEDDRANQNFSRRLIAKFHIFNTNSFWSREFPEIPEQSLKPSDDKDFSWV